MLVIKTKQNICLTQDATSFIYIYFAITYKSRNSKTALIFTLHFHQSVWNSRENYYPIRWLCRQGLGWKGGLWFVRKARQMWRHDSTSFASEGEDVSAASDIIIIIIFFECRSVWDFLTTVVLIVTAMAWRRGDQLNGKDKGDSDKDGFNVKFGRRR